ncbi:NAD(P)-dependent oxidoreductase [Spongisporangium articulatum]|uniref:NAD(P)-dependent oxidoreductase n=1 Tax=Spongisporangium articulatum TaxID=3362603 RepID=A0ABW8ANF3_9ACTN
MRHLSRHTDTARRLRRVSTPTVALLGTGTMGAGMARNLAAAGLPTRVWNRTYERAAPLADDGCQVTRTAAEAAAGADVVLTMLFDLESVRSAIEAAAPASGTVWVQSSTVGVAGTAELAAHAERQGLPFVDAPVLGTKQPAEKGQLVVLASGPSDLAPRVAPLFDAVGARTMWVGDAGAGTRLKLVCNGWVFTVLEGIAEALRTAEALGVDPALFLEAVKGGAMDAPYVQLKGAAMLSGAYDPAFALSGALKDAGLIEEAAREAGADPAVVSVARAYFAKAAEAGHGELDMAATFLAH